jgi:multimeric flavodoxin WrbA
MKTLPNLRFLLLLHGKYSSHFEFLYCIEKIPSFTYAEVTYCTSERTEYMDIIAFNGSARRNGNTAFFIEKTFEPLREQGFTCEMVQLAGHSVRGCAACLGCREEENTRCTINDIVNDCIDKMYAAKAIIIGSPTYFSDITTETKGLIDRAGFVSRGNGNPLRRKVGAGIAVARRAGAIHALMSINQFFLINEMISVGSSYWNVGFGKDIGDAQSDDEGIETMHCLGENIAWILKKIHARELV